MYIWVYLSTNQENKHKYVSKVFIISYTEWKLKFAYAGEARHSSNGMRQIAPSSVGVARRRREIPYAKYVM